MATELRAAAAVTVVAERANLRHAWATARARDRLDVAVSLVTSPGGAPVHLRGRVLGVHKKMPDGTWKGFRGSGIID